MNKKVKILLLISVLIVLLCLLLYWLLFHVFYIFDPGVDSLVKPESGPFAAVTRGYMRLRSEKSKYDADDTVSIQINTAFYESQEAAQKAEYINFVIVCDKYLEFVPVSFTAEKQPIDWDTDGIYGETVNDDFYALKCMEFDAEDLVYGGPVVTRYSLPFSVDFEVRIKEDAPAEFWADVKIYARAGFALSDGSGLQSVSEENEAYLYVYCKDGKLYLSGDSVKDAKSRAGIRHDDDPGVAVPISVPNAPEEDD